MSMQDRSEAKSYIFDILRFLALEEAEKRKMLFSESSPKWFRNVSPLEGVLGEFVQFYEMIFDPDTSPELKAAEELASELAAVVELMLIADNHPSGARVYTRDGASLERTEWRLVRRLSRAVLDAYREPAQPFHGDWQMIFAN